MHAESIGSDPFLDERAARNYLEALRWRGRITCPHCGSRTPPYRLHGHAHRAGVYKCAEYGEQFTVCVGTDLESTKIPLHLWLQAVRLACGGRRINGEQLHREIGVSHKTALSMLRRIRAAGPWTVDDVLERLLHLQP